MNVHARQPHAPFHAAHAARARHDLRTGADCCVVASRCLSRCADDEEGAWEVVDLGGNGSDDDDEEDEEDEDEDDVDARSASSGGAGSSDEEDAPITRARRRRNLREVRGRRLIRTCLVVAQLKREDVVEHSGAVARGAVARLASDDVPVLRGQDVPSHARGRAQAGDQRRVGGKHWCHGGCPRESVSPLLPCRWRCVLVSGRAFARHLLTAACACIQSIARPAAAFARVSRHPKFPARQRGGCAVAERPAVARGLPGAASMQCSHRSASCANVHAKLKAFLFVSHLPGLQNKMGRKRASNFNETLRQEARTRESLRLFSALARHIPA